MLKIFECKCDEDCGNPMEVDHYHDLTTSRVGFLIDGKEVVLDRDQLMELKMLLTEYLNTYGE